MQEGMLDIRRKAAILTEQKLQNDHLENENLALKKEISKIKNDQRYQRRLAREHLGVIGKGEYLILFSKEGDSPK
jgi:cell division protein FtsB